jgi:hypothetical protein
MLPQLLALYAAPVVYPYLDRPAAGLRTGTGGRPRWPRLSTTRPGACAASMAPASAVAALAQSASLASMSGKNVAVVRTGIFAANFHKFVTIPAGQIGNRPDLAQLHN